MSQNDAHVSSWPKLNISRAILITTGSLFPRSNSEVGFMRIGRDDDGLGVIVVEASASTEVCPSEYFVVYMWMHSLLPSAREDLQNYVLRLFEPSRSDYFRFDRPSVMWVSYYNQKCTSAEAISAFDGSGDTVPNRPVPKNVRFVAGPSGSLDFEDTLQESLAVFQSIYPGLPFLPRVPEPEEIVIDGIQNLLIDSKSSESEAGSTG